MYKELTVELDGVENYYSIILGDRSLTKTASSISDEVSEFIKNHNFDTERYLYVLINALGAEEYYGANKNGDGFPEYYEGKPNLIHDGTNHGYKTFEHFAKLYKHHANKDPKKSYGDVLLSIYNHKMHRVELIVRMDRRKAPEECHKVESGKVLSTSMGTKVPYDVCSICGNKAKTRAQYCYHLKKMMGKVLPNGEKVRAINPFPKFFDISMVFIPADVTSRVIRKIASDKSAGSKTAVEKKKAAIIKKVPAEGIESTSIDEILEKLIDSRTKSMEKHEQPLPNDMLNSLGRFPLKKSLSTLICCGVMPKPREFQRIILIKMRKPRLADTLESQNLVFNDRVFDLDPDITEGRMPLSLDGIDDDILSIIRPMVPRRSRWQPFLLDRLLNRCKLASAPGSQPTKSNVIPVMAAISGLFMLFRAAIPKLLAQQIYSAAETSLRTAAVIKTHQAFPRGSDLFATNAYSMHPQNAEDLLKISHINNAMNRLFDKNYSQYEQKVASSMKKKVYSLGKYLGEVSGVTGSGPSIVRRGMIGVPAVSLASGLNKSDRAAGKKTNPFMNVVGDYPKLTLAAGVLGGHKIPKAIGGLLKGGSMDSILDGEYSAEIIFRDGDLLDIATISKIVTEF